MNPDGGEHRQHIGAPSRAGDVWFWPATIQSDRWHKKTLPWFDGDALLELHASAFAYAKARTLGAFDGLTGYTSSKAAVEAFADSLSCAEGELCAALMDVIPVEDECAELHAQLKKDAGIAEDERPADDWEELVTHLIAATGLARDVWERQESREQTIDVLTALNKQTMAAAGGTAQLSGTDPHVVAAGNLGIAIRTIKQRHKEAAENGE
jgi:hypothetical protein